MKEKIEWIKRSPLNGFALVWLLEIILIDSAYSFFLLEASKFIRALDQKYPDFDLFVIWPQLGVTTQLSSIISYHSQPRSHLLVYSEPLNYAQYGRVFKFQCLPPPNTHISYPDQIIMGRSNLPCCCSPLCVSMDCLCTFVTSKSMLPGECQHLRQGTGIHYHTPCPFPGLTNLWVQLDTYL